MCALSLSGSDAVSVINEVQSVTTIVICGCSLTTVVGGLGSNCISNILHLLFTLPRKSVDIVAA
jgi:hypothetical protein